MIIVAVAIIDCREELLVPPKRAKELWRKFVFRFDIISKRIRVSHIGYLKAGFIKLRPDLQMMPGETGILPENKFPIVVNVASGRQGRFGFTPKI